jgi:hypothetical protein
MASRPRQHIRTLIVEFLGQQADPDDVEAAVLLPMLDSLTEGPRVLSAIAGSPGWFRRLRHHSSLRQWMGKAPEEAAHCVPFLTAAASFDHEAVLNLLAEYWCDDAAYDPLILKVLLDLNAWTSRTVDIAARLVHRSAWWGTALLVYQMAESAPDLASRVLRADLNRRVEEALQEQPTPEPTLPSEANEREHVLDYLLGDSRRLALGDAWDRYRESIHLIQALCPHLSSNDLARLEEAVRTFTPYKRIMPEWARVIEATCSSPAVLVESALNVVEFLGPYTSIEPTLVLQVCQEILTAIGPSISRVASSLSRLAEPMTNIALTLHRQDAYREAGLALFEQLLRLNVQEARAALEVLDRPPMRRTSPGPVRRRRRPRS